MKMTYEDSFVLMYISKQMQRQFHNNMVMLTSINDVMTLICSVYEADFRVDMIRNKLDTYWVHDLYPTIIVSSKDKEWILQKQPNGDVSIEGPPLQSLQRESS